MKLKVAVPALFVFIILKFFFQDKRQVLHLYFMLRNILHI